TPLAAPTPRPRSCAARSSTCERRGQGSHAPPTRRESRRADGGQQAARGPRARQGVHRRGHRTPLRRPGHRQRADGVLPVPAHPGSETARHQSGRIDPVHTTQRVSPTHQFLPSGIAPAARGRVFRSHQETARHAATMRTKLMMNLLMPSALLGPNQFACAVTYLRVSTKEQAHRGGREEGYSLPDQRKAVNRKAEGLGAVVVAEFIEPGESGKSLKNRKALQELLAFVAENHITYCIVPKV